MNPLSGQMTEQTICANWAGELAGLVYARERAHSKADKVIDRIGHRVFTFAQRGLSRNKAA